jgi:hypothetical protein
LTLLAGGWTQPKEIRDAEGLTLSLLQVYGLDEWHVRCDDIPHLGQCDYEKKTIFLARGHVLHRSPAEVKDTILHEIAHALEPGDGHGSRWQARLAAIRRSQEVANFRLQSLMGMLRLHLDLEDLTPEQKKLSSLRVAKVLQKILDNDRVKEDVKERAKSWVHRTAADPQVRKMFRESSESDIEAFFQLPEPQQDDVVVGIPTPAFSRLVQYLKAMQPTLSPESMALIETRFARTQRKFGWSDMIWILIVLIITGMLMSA